MSNSQVTEAVQHLEALNREFDISKRFKEKTEIVITLLRSEADLAIEKALLELEELNFLEMSSYNRTRVWDVISMLESIKS